MKKLSLRQKEYLGAGVAVGGFLLSMLVQQEWAQKVGFAMLFLGVILTMMWLRCPKCGRSIASRRAKQCRRCGEVIDWNAK